MIIWIDEHLSARLAPWFKSEFNVDAVHIGALGLSSEDDAVIFERARAAGAALLTNDFDFVLLVDRLGSPPQIIWLRTGNASTRSLKALLSLRFGAALEALELGEPIIELG